LEIGRTTPEEKKRLGKAVVRIPGMDEKNALGRGILAERGGFEPPKGC
jgi:hypothetical protein